MPSGQQHGRAARAGRSATRKYQVLTAMELGLSYGSQPVDLINQLNQLGKDGWELASIVPVETPDTKDFWLVFKK
jgi:hypothetical protein